MLRAPSAGQRRAVGAAYLLSQAFLPGRRAARRGRVINMVYCAAKSGGLAAGTACAVLKAAMIWLIFSIAREGAGEGVTANAIAPACVMSPMVSEQLTDAQRQTQLAAIPVGRFCEPEEVAHAVMFPASPLAGFITGEVIDMNGGMHLDQVWNGYPPETRPCHAVQAPACRRLARRSGRDAPQWLAQFRHLPEGTRKPSVRHVRISRQRFRGGSPGNRCRPRDTALAA
ncbi:MAG: SDR family oxidoreductase [Rhodobacter sp.]|nr:SDR family oxidoreductase [Rhodobacter sp.]